MARVNPPSLQAHLKPLERAGIAELLKATNAFTSILGNRSYPQTFSRSWRYNQPRTTRSETQDRLDQCSVNPRPLWKCQSPTQVMSLSKAANKTEEARNQPTARYAEEVCRVLGLAGTFVKDLTDIDPEGVVSHWKDITAQQN
ncbi:hypothetical protein ACTXT7_005825 [Hymenolepis weldensis]